MKTYEEFLAEHSDIPEYHRIYYVRWVRMFLSRVDEHPLDGHESFGPAATGPARSHDPCTPSVPGATTRLKRTATVEEIIRFLAFMERRYEPWQVQQARRALQLYAYYVSRVTPRAGKEQSTSGLRPRFTAVTDWDGARQTVTQLMRLQHYSLRTETAYLGWMRRFSVFAKKGPPSVTATDLRSFLSYLAVERHVAPATQKLAFNALLFVYRNVLGVEIEGLHTVVPTYIPRKLPVVLTVEELRKVLGCMDGVHRLMATLVYGSGLRLHECLSLRIQDIDFARNSVTVRAGMGNKDRQTVLPGSTRKELGEHLARVRKLFDKDRKAGVAGVALPGALERKLPGASTEWTWFWAFPAPRLSIDPRTRIVRRFHEYPTTLQRPFVSQWFSRASPSTRPYIRFVIASRRI
jgi:integrase